MLKLKRPISETIQKSIWHGTAFLRPLPDFIITGVAKCGTESFWAAMMQHPQIAKPNIHSIHYFDEVYHKNLQWYQAHFPLKKRLSDKLITGEKSTFYISHPYCAERIHKVLPDVKLIVLLRNPVDRAVSQYGHFKSRGYEDLPIDEAMRQEEERIEPYLSTMDDKSVYKAGHPLKVYSYKARGHYAEHLKKYFEFFDRKQMKIIKSERFFSEPDDVLKETFEFLGINSDVKIPDLRPVNTRKRKENVPDSTYDYLEEYFAPHNKKLQELLGEDFTW